MIDRLPVLRNLIEQNVTLASPWDFAPTAYIPDAVRYSRQDRQAWYRNSSTSHQFYSGFEGINAAVRVGKENPALYLLAVAADYDLKLSDEEISKGIERMGRLKPAYLERSLSGNFRLVWTLSEKLLVHDNDFAEAFLKELVTFLNLHSLPGLDEGAFCDPARTLCNGGTWQCLNASPLPADELRGLLAQVAHKFTFSSVNLVGQIPLEVVEKALREKFKAEFAWSGPFDLETQGPSFWIPGSASPKSALVKANGLISFAAHAEKLFYSWADLLGVEFVAKYERESLGKAIKDVYFDGVSYWCKPEGNNGKFAPTKQCVLERQLVGEYGIREGKLKGEKESQLRRALRYIEQTNYVSTAGAHPMYPPGIIVRSDGRRALNTWTGTVMRPAEGAVAWNAQDFPLIYPWFNAMLTPETLDWIMAYTAHAYRAALAGRPLPGQALFLMGPAQTGKSLYAREVLGRILGGFADAGTYFFSTDLFNADLYEASVWSVDDEMAFSAASKHSFMNKLKKLVANSMHRSNQKFQKPGIIEWLGRAVITLNLDEASMRTLLPTDSGIIDKIAYIRVKSSALSEFSFPHDRDRTAALLDAELPRFCKLLTGWQIPDRLRGDARYGIKTYLDETMVDKANQSSEGSTFFEILIDFLRAHFHTHKEAQEWYGTVTQLVRAIQTDSRNTEMLRRYPPEVVQRSLSSIHAAGRLKMEVGSVGPEKLRVWRIRREDVSPAKFSSSGEIQLDNAADRCDTIFNKPQQ